MFFCNTDLVLENLQKLYNNNVTVDIIIFFENIFGKSGYNLTDKQDIVEFGENYPEKAAKKAYEFYKVEKEWLNFGDFGLKNDINNNNDVPDETELCLFKELSVLELAKLQILYLTEI